MPRLTRWYVYHVAGNRSADRWHRTCDRIITVGACVVLVCMATGVLK